MKQKNDEKYDLYTEHIVPDTGEKIKQGVKKALMTAVLAIFFGLTAGVVMLLIYHKGMAQIEGDYSRPVRLPGNETDNNYEDDNNGNEVVIPENTETESVIEPTFEWDEDVKQQLENMNIEIGALKAVSDKVNKSVVTINKVSNNENIMLGNGYQNSAFGIVMAEDDKNYYILTDSYQADGSSSLAVTYHDGTVAQGYFVEKDKTTQFAIIKTSKDKAGDISIAIISDINSMSEGDIVVAVGELYGFTSSMGYGIVTGKNIVVTDTDAEFRLLTTDIIGTETSFGVLSNLNGDIIGIVTTNYNLGTSNHLVSYYAKEVSIIIENLMNGKTTPYLGVRGQTVNLLTSQMYAIPEGVYVSAVETNSPAYYAGVQPGDIVIEVDNNQIKDMKHLMEAVSSNKVGDSIGLKIKRKGREDYKEIVFTITLGVE